MVDTEVAADMPSPIANIYILSIFKAIIKLLYYSILFFIFLYLYVLCFAPKETEIKANPT